MALFERNGDAKQRRPVTIVEIVKSVLVKRKYNSQRMLSDQWMFGCIQRRLVDVRREFLVEFVDEISKQVPVPIIQRRIEQGTKTISDIRKAYLKLDEYTYEHKGIILAEYFVDPDDPEIHRQNVENM